MKSDTSSNSGKRILFLGNANNPLLVNLSIELRKLDLQFTIDIISEAPVTNKQAFAAFTRIVSLPAGKLARSIPGIKTAWLAFQFRRSLKKLNGSYDVVHMFFLHVGYTQSKSLLRRMSRKLIITVFGSELYRSPEVILRQLEPLASMADRVTAANENTLRDFMKRFSIAPEKGVICRFGLRPLDEIAAQAREYSVYPDERTDSGPQSRTSFEGVLRYKKPDHKREAGLPEKSFIITCGYNASAGQQHEVIIDSIAQVKSKLPEDYLLVFPLAMGEPSRRELLRMKLELENLKYHFITEFLPDTKLAHLRSATDIMIQVQKTDQLSGAMQEHLFAGNVVITGSWLPYQTFVNAGVKYWTVDAPNEVGTKLCELLPDYYAHAKSVEGNAEKIWELSSWEKCRNTWFALYRK